MSARDAILGRLKSRLEGRPGRKAAADVEQHVTSHPRNLIPARAQLPPREQLALFEQEATTLSATTHRVKSLDEVPEAIAGYLRGQNLPLKVKRSPAAELAALPWQRTPLLEVTEGRAEDSDQTSVTPVFAAVAETGTLVLHSGAETPTTLAFLPETHIAVVKASRVVGTYEEVFELTRQALGEGRMPRTFNFITGPSRTGDIEQKIELGAHGPRRLHLILVEDA